MNEPANSGAANSDAQARAYGEIAGGVQPSGTIVLSNAAGRLFYARCSRCGWVSTSHADKTQPGIHARHHEDACS